MVMGNMHGGCEDNSTIIQTTINHSLTQPEVQLLPVMLQIIGGGGGELLSTCVCVCMNLCM